MFATAQSVWIFFRMAGRSLLGAERFDLIIDKTGLHGLKSRVWLERFRAPDGSDILYRPHDRCIIDEVYGRSVYSGTEISPGQTVVDVGAHIGVFSLMAARRVGPKGHVVCFEPSPRAAEVLRRNLEANGLSWVRHHAVALAETEGSADLFVADDAGNNPAADTLSDTPGRGKVSVRLRRLDDVLAEEGIFSVDHLKIDVEGAELRVLDGAPRTLARTRRIAMEVHPPRVDPAEVRRRLEALGFTCRSVSESADSVILDARRAAAA